MKKALYFSIISCFLYTSFALAIVPFETIIPGTIVTLKYGCIPASLKIIGELSDEEDKFFKGVVTIEASKDGKIIPYKFECTGYLGDPDWGPLIITTTDKAILTTNYPPNAPPSIFLQILADGTTGKFGPE